MARSTNSKRTRAKARRGGSSKSKHRRFLNQNQSLFDSFLEEQGGVCGICGKEPIGKLDRDHDHGRMIARGMLCRGCNIRVGRETDPEWFEKSAQYLRKAYLRAEMRA